MYYKDRYLKLPVTLNQWSFDDLYKALEQIYPREEPTPEALTLTLRPYQKQDLAFMVDQEQSSDSTLVGANGKRGGILADEMGAFSSLHDLPVPLACVALIPVRCSLRRPLSSWRTQAWARRSWWPVSSSPTP